MKQPSHGSFSDALLLAVVTAVVVGIVASVANFTRSAIKNRSNSELMAQIHTMLPPDSYDNDLLLDRITISAPDMLATTAPVQVLRARRQGEPVAAVLLPPGVQGYGGPIHLIVVVDRGGTLLGVQVLSHRETRGIGDQFERNDWLDSFRQRSLNNPRPSGWAVRKDGGEFDHFTGATITPRAIVSMVRRSLEFYHSRRRTIFSQESEP